MNLRNTYRGAGLKWVAAAALCCSSHAFAEPVKRNLCIYDALAQNGVIYQAFQAYVAQALDWGVKFVPHPYTQEDLVVSDFKSGRCDAIVITGVHNMEFVKFAGSLDMVGGLQTYPEEHSAIEAISSPKAAKYMRAGDYEVAGVAPGGKVYLFARHKANLASLDKAAGKKIGVLAFDKQAVSLSDTAGAAPIPGTVAAFGPQFNNGTIEYTYAPAIGYEALELYKGLGKAGGVSDYVFAMLSLQVDIHSGKFPPGFGQRSRTWVADSMWPIMLGRIEAADSAIAPEYWVHTDPAQAKIYSGMMLRVREQLWDNNWYDHDMQHLLKQIRCKADPSMGECTQGAEGGAG